MLETELNDGQSSDEGRAGPHSPEITSPAGQAPAAARSGATPPAGDDPAPAKGRRRAARRPAAGQASATASPDSAGAAAASDSPKPATRAARGRASTRTRRAAGKDGPGDPAA